MEIMISEDFENELSVTYDGTECRIESCDVESIGVDLREITILLRKALPPSVQEEPASLRDPDQYVVCAHCSEPLQWRNTVTGATGEGLSGQEQQATVDHTARQDSEPSSVSAAYGPRKPYPAPFGGNW